MVTVKAKKIKEVKAVLKKPRPAKVKAVVEDVPVVPPARQTFAEQNLGGPAGGAVGAVAVMPKFISAVGRRKRAQARVRMTEVGKGLFIVNGRELKNYFPSPNLFETVLAPLKATGQDLNHDFSVKVVGGGWRGQAEAVRHGLARVLVKWNSDFRNTLKKTSFLTRDSREKERKKPGLKKARRAPQWAKR